MLHLESMLHSSLWFKPLFLKITCTKSSCFIVFVLFEKLIRKKKRAKKQKKKEVVVEFLFGFPFFLNAKAF